MDNSITFFTMDSFTHTAGETVRMIGIVNAASRTRKVTLISNCNDSSLFNQSVKLINLKHKPSATSVRLLQFATAILPYRISNFFFRSTLQSLKNTPLQGSDKIIAFKYSDLMFAYMAKKNKIIGSYLCDIHGIARLEFTSRPKDGVARKVYNLFRLNISKILEKKIFSNALCLIFTSNHQQLIFEKMYPFIARKENIILEEGLNDNYLSQSIDNDFIIKIKNKIGYSNKNAILLFAGTFKRTSGVIDLIEAFSKSEICTKNAKLLLVGNGHQYHLANELIKKHNLNSKIFLLGNHSYKKLKSFHAMSDIIICPDSNNPFSNAIIHIKYYDSLASGKIVINGSFDSLKKVNERDQLSVSFKPSDINDLSSKIDYCLENKTYLMNKYKGNTKLTKTKFSYNQRVVPFLCRLDKLI